MECSAKYKAGVTEFANLEVAIRGVARYYTVAQIVEMGSLDKKEVDRALSGQLSLW